jgi:hypothetical protein
MGENLLVKFQTFFTPDCLKDDVEDEERVEGAVLAAAWRGWWRGSQTGHSRTKWAHVS